MDGMKKLLFTTIAILIAAAVFALIMNLTKNDLQNQVNENTASASRSSSADTDASCNSNSTQPFIFFSFSRNPYYNSDVSGFLLGSDGKKYNYLLLNNKTELTAEDAYEMAVKQSSGLSSISFSSDFEISNLLSSIENIPSDMEFRTEENAGRQGTETVYAVKQNGGKTELLKIYSVGDTEEIPNDSSAETIRKYFIRKLRLEAESGIGTGIGGDHAAN